MEKEIKTKVFAQYLGQKYTRIDCTGDLFYFGIDDFEKINIISLLLKPISKITDEDANEVAKISYPEWNEMLMDNDKLLMIGKDKLSNYLYRLYDLKLECAQYLQSRGYALPYLNYSVEDLVKEGVYKLEE